MSAPAEANPQAGTERSLPLPSAPSPLGRLANMIYYDLVLNDMRGTLDTNLSQNEEINLEGGCNEEDDRNSDLL